MTHLTYDQVQERWLAAGGPNTLGILQAFGTAVDRWDEEEATAAAISSFRFLGSEPHGMWDDPTGGTFRVGDLQPAPPPAGLRWNPAWALIVVRDPDTSDRVILDGNKRARGLQLAVMSGATPKSQLVDVITDELYPVVGFISKALSSLWR